MKVVESDDIGILMRYLGLLLGQEKHGLIRFNFINRKFQQLSPKSSQSCSIPLNINASQTTPPDDLGVHTYLSLCVTLQVVSV